jgi:hypothetical protein
MHGVWGGAASFSKQPCPSPTPSTVRTYVRAPQDAIIALAQQWVNWDPNPETKAQTVAMLERGNAAELTLHFGSRLEFGTAGLRGPMGPGPNCMSDLCVIQAAQV